MEMLAILIVIVGVVLVIVVFGDEFAEAGSSSKNVSAKADETQKNEQSIELKKKAKEEALLKKEILKRESERRKSMRKDMMEAAWYADLIKKIKAIMIKNEQVSYFKGEFKIDTLKRIKDKYEKEHKVELKAENDFLSEQFILYIVFELIDLDLIEVPRYTWSCSDSNVCSDYDDDSDYDWDDEDDDWDDDDEEGNDDYRTYTFQDDYGNDGDDMYDSNGEFREF